MSEVSETSVEGQVKWFSADKGYGFVTVGEDDVFVHYTAIAGDGFRTLEEGQSVLLDVCKGPKGLSAQNVVKVAGSSAGGAL